MQGLANLEIKCKYRRVCAINSASAINPSFRLFSTALNHVSRPNGMPKQYLPLKGTSSI